MLSLFKTKKKAFRIGVWCDYGFTLLPTSGIGVFVYHLVAGLLQLNERVEVVLLVRREDQQVASAFFTSPGRAFLPSRGHRLTEANLRIIPDQAWWLTWSDSWLRIGRTFQQRGAGLKQSAQYLIGTIIHRVWGDLKRKKIGRTVLWAGFLPIGFLILWAVDAFRQLLIETARVIVFPLRLFDRFFRQWVLKPRSSLELAQQAGCDVWVYPYLGYDDALLCPSVLLIHDLVTRHFPQFFEREVVDRIDRLALVRPAEATLCACMSRFIRDADLYGVLGLSSSKVRLVRPAPPTDFPEITEERAAGLKPSILTRPFLLMPAGIRRHKNQENLIRALGVLRDRYGENGLDLVLTGESAAGLTADLKRLIKDGGLEGRVHFLGLVPREQLAALYKCAYATIMPSLYEQGSFPVYEALHWGCPVACSDIPPLREQCQAMGEAMLYFDPLDPDAIARAILKIGADREGIRSRQFAASRSLWQRTWKDVAQEWLAVFKEAAEIARASTAKAESGRSAA